MDNIKNYIADQNYQELVKFCEDLELELAVNPDPNITPEEFYGPFLFGYLFEDDLPSAKFLWKRIPENIKSSSKELNLIWNVVMALWKRDHEKFYENVNSNKWNHLFTPLIEQLAEKIRQSMINLISEAYSSILIDEFIKYVGLPKENALSIVEGQGWTIDNSKNMLYPNKIVKEEFKPISLNNFSQLTDLVTNLEKY
ncbi:19725_t:CDS:2 [Entrophospora sp. SA101]|nr:3289_t:CDS:2 [Entrophospora candida]CAH1764288.1 8026_t:CDS:2 [Entrophospora sp. SA101]CAG8525695.1 1218_t:CDS:2 [Entrophospora candida]CAJ0630630.1 511_t:CDS:2 [Entrophospora sp. SA101]CAJ0630639.1 516_t:CDS:2 [Entrophospora sp. SA101]